MGLIAWDMEVPYHPTSKDSLSEWITRISRCFSADKRSIRNKSNSDPNRQPTSDWQVRRKLSHGNSMITQPSTSLTKVLLWLLISRPRCCSDPAEQLQLLPHTGRYNPFQTISGLSQILSQPSGKLYPSPGDVLTALLCTPPLQGKAELCQSLCWSHRFCS